MMLKGKNAIVTGSTSGIGLSVAEALAKQGANVVINGFGDEREIKKIQTDIEQLGVRSAYIGADMSKPDEIAAMVEQVEAEFGGVDVLVNNAGIQYTSLIEDFPTEKWDAVLAINLSSSFHTIRSAIPGMRARNWGRIVNIASAHGLVASATKAAYVAAKHGVVGLTKVVALETADTGITCNAVCPGWVLTPLVQKQVDERAQREGTSVEKAKQALLAEKQPSGEFVTTGQVAAMTIFLCSDDASQIRGAAFSIDGGWVAQ